MITILRKNIEYEAPKAEETVQGQGYGGIWSNHGRTEAPVAATLTPPVPTETPSPEAETPIPSA